jgi:hypothetical protein
MEKISTKKAFVVLTKAFFSQVEIEELNIQREKNYAAAAASLAAATLIFFNLEGLGRTLP